MTLGTLLYAIIFHNVSLERSTDTKDPFTAEGTMLVTFLNREITFLITLQRRTPWLTQAMPGESASYS